MSKALLIGCGDHGANTLLPAALAAGIRVTALVDADVEAAALVADKYAIPRAFAEVGKLDLTGYDAVLLALPVAEQARFARWALEHGLATFIEKPPAPTLERLRELIELARRAGVPTAVGMNFRWAQGVLELEGAIESGEYGQIAYARVEHYARKPIAPFGPGDSLAASLFHAHGIHAIDLARFLTPGTDRIGGQMIEVERGQLCVLTGEDGAGRRLEAHFGSNGASFQHRVQVVTTTGDMLVLEDLTELRHRPSGADQHVKQYPGDRVLWHRGSIKGGHRPAGYETELAAFKALLDGEDQPRLATLESLLATYEAYDTLLAQRGLAWTA